MRRPLLAIVAVFALAAATCGGDSDEPPTGAGESPGTTAGRAADTGGSGPTVELTAKGIAFGTTTLTAPSGPVSIRFENQDDGIPHNLHVTGNGVDAKTEIEEGPATQTLDLELEPGTYGYVCDVHPQQMKGELTVT